VIERAKKYRALLLTKVKRSDVKLSTLEGLRHHLYFCAGLLRR